MRSALVPSVVCLIAVSVAAAACGGVVDDGPRDDDGASVGTPLAFYTSDPGDRCPLAAPVENARVGLTRKYTSERYAVASITFADECTGLGGQYILAKDLYEESIAFQGKYFLGGHGCRAWEIGPGMNAGGPTLPFGVVRYTPTNSIQEIPPGVCVAIDEGNRERGITTSAAVHGIALFATRIEAERFARSLGWPAP
jgi:hypothetical protein